MPKQNQFNFKTMNTNWSDPLRPKEDVELVVNADYTKQGALRKVKGYEQVGNSITALLSQEYTSTADWDSGTHSSTRASDGDLIMSGGVLKQDSNNDSYNIHGDNWIAQKFSALGPQITDLGVYVDKVTGSTLQTYDDFNDNSKDTSRWNYTEGSGQVTEAGGQMRFYMQLNGGGQTSKADTNNKTGASPPGEPITGCEFYFARSGGHGQGGDMRVRLTNGTDYIEVSQLLDVGDTIIRLGGKFGSGDSSRWASTGGTFEIVNDGTAVKVYENSTLRLTLSGKQLETGDNLFLEAYASKGNLDDGSTIYGILDNVKVLTTAATNADLKLEVHPDSSGDPSGTAITNGSVDIDIEDITGTKQLLERALATAATTTTGNDYWLVLYQSGGDDYSYIRAYKQNTDVYSDGAIKVSSDGGSSWSADSDNSGDTDLAFRVYFGFESSGSWLSDTINLASGQTLEQLVLNFSDLNSNDKITQVDITNTGGTAQSSYTTDIESGTSITLRSSDFDSGFSYTLDTAFKVKISLASGGTSTPVVESLVVDSPEKEILDLQAFYKSDGTRALMAVVGSDILRLQSGIWQTVDGNQTSGLQTGTIIFNASANSATLAADDVVAGDLSSFTCDYTAGSPSQPADNAYQDYFVVITTGTGSGQVRIIEKHFDQGSNVEKYYVDQPFETAPDSSSDFAIYAADDHYLVFNDTDNPSKYDGTSFNDLRGTPPKGDIVAEYKDRLLVISGSKINYSLPNNSEGWRDNDYIYIRRNDGGNINGVDVVGDELVISKDNGRKYGWEIFDDGDPRNSRVREIESNKGNASYRSQTKWDKIHYFADQNGVYDFPRSKATGSLTDDIREVYEAAESNTDDFAMGADKEVLYNYIGDITLDLGDSRSITDTVVCMDTRTGGTYLRDDMNSRVFTRFKNSSGIERLYFGDNDGHVYKLNSGNTNGTNPITMLIRSKPYFTELDYFIEVQGIHIKCENAKGATVYARTSKTGSFRKALGQIETDVDAYIPFNGGAGEMFQLQVVHSGRRTRPIINGWSIIYRVAGNKNGKHKRNN